MQAGRPTTVVFDLGGVLIDWDPRRLYRKILADAAEVEWFLAEVCHPAWNLEQDRGRSFAAAIEEAAGRHPRRRAEIAAYHARWIEMIGGPIDGTVALLGELDREGVPLYALSNWSAETFPLVRDDPTYAFLGRFRHIVVSGEVGLVKPEPAIYAHLLKQAGAPAGDCLFIDDNEANIEAARELGFHVHRFTGPDGLGAALRAHRLLP